MYSLDVVPQATWQLSDIRVRHRRRLLQLAKKTVIQDVHQRRLFAGCFVSAARRVKAWGRQGRHISSGSCDHGLTPVGRSHHESANSEEHAQGEVLSAHNSINSRVGSSTDRRIIGDSVLWQFRPGSGHESVGSDNARAVDTVKVGQVFLGARYLRLIEGGTGAYGCRGACHPVTPITCNNGSCRNVLSYVDMILDCNRRWSLTGNQPERAMFMNALCDGSYFTRNPHEHRLAQGLFDMADVHCRSCAAQVGYAFVLDRSDENRNVNQVGRFGLVCSRVRLEAGTEVYVAAGKFRRPRDQKTRIETSL